MYRVIGVEGAYGIGFDVRSAMILDFGVDDLETGDIRAERSNRGMDGGNGIGQDGGDWGFLGKVG